MNDIKIHVKSQYLDEQSRPESHQYVHAYTIRIENAGPLSVQLLSRRWLITDAHGDCQEVQGMGVVGEQPHIAPGESYIYSSGAVIATPTGTMEGAYEMRDQHGQSFQALIPLFSLVKPGALH